MEDLYNTLIEHVDGEGRAKGTFFEEILERISSLQSNSHFLIPLDIKSGSAGVSYYCVIESIENDKIVLHKSSETHPDRSFRLTIRSQKAID